MPRQLILAAALCLSVLSLPQIALAAPWLSVVNTPAEIHFIPNDGAGQIIAFGDKIYDLQAMHIGQGGEPYIVALVKHKRRLTLDVYDYSGSR